MYFSLCCTFSLFQNTVKSSIYIAHTDTHYNFCQFQPLSLKEAYEERLLLKSIAWPETPPLPFPPSLSKTSDPFHSTFTILSGREGGQWQKGDNLEVLIQIYDFHGHPKKSGGDVLLARLHNPALGAGVAGQVVDHLNGSYSTVFYLPWEGNAEVEVILKQIFKVQLVRASQLTHSESADLFRTVSLEYLINPGKTLPPYYEAKRTWGLFLNAAFGLLDHLTC